MKSGVKILSLVLSLVLVLSFFPVGAAAESGDASQVQEDSNIQDNNNSVDVATPAVTSPNNDSSNAADNLIEYENIEVATPATTMVLTATPMEGDGTAGNPYQITTQEQLDAVRNNLSAHYKLMNDIDLSSWGNWEPIGIEAPFTGVFDGQEYIVHNMTITGKYAYAGFFGRAGNSTIKNLGLNNTNISVSLGGDVSIGSICGDGSYGTRIENCYNSGNISSIQEINHSSNGSSCVGGIAGKNSDIINCYNTGSITSSSFSDSYAGGILGLGFGSRISNCYNTGSIKSTSYQETGAGGIVGLGSSNGNITDCYNTGKISSETKSTFDHDAYAGGIRGCGTDKITNCYNIGTISSEGYSGGIACFSFSNFENYDNHLTNCYYLSGSANLGVGHYTEDIQGQVEKRSSTQLRALAPVLGSAFLPDYNYINNGYPILAWWAEESEPRPIINITLDGATSIDAVKASQGFEPQTVDFSASIQNIVISTTPEDEEKATAKNTKVSFAFPDEVEYKTKDSSDDWKSGLLEYDIGDFENGDSLNYQFDLQITPQSATDTFDIKVTVSADNINDVIKQHSISASSGYLLVDEVKKYLSRQGANNWIGFVYDVTNTNASWEEINKEVITLFSFYGITNPTEGVKYFNDSLPHRVAYERLLNNKLYLAEYFRKDLNENPYKRATLVAQGLVYNFELFDWLNITNYATGDYPGVKKYKKMLLDFMESSSTASEVNVALSKTKEYYSIISNVSNTVIADEKNAALKALSEDANVLKADEILGKFILDVNKKTGTIDIDLKKTSEASALMSAFKEVGAHLSFVQSSTSNFLELMNLAENMAIYEAHREFLQEIVNAPANGPIPLELAAAAQSILLDMDGPTGLRQVINQAVSIVGFLDVDGVIKLSFDDLLGVSTQLKAFKFAVWCSNLGIDVGSFVKEAAYTEGFACLAAYYKEELKKTAGTFSDDGGDTEENAWKFYKNYVMLWKMREYGEKKFAEMYDVKGAFGELIKWFNGINMEDVNGVVKSTLALLKDSEFNLDPSIGIPQQYRYLQKIIMHCPVAIEIIDKQGNLIYTIPDGVEIDETNSYGRFVSIYNPMSGDYSKIAYLKDSQNYTIRAVSNGYGYVSCSLTQAVGSDDCVVYGFNNIAVGTGSIINTATTIESNTPPTYTVDLDGDGSNDANGQMAEKEQDSYVPVSGVNLADVQINLQVGDSKMLGFEIVPNNATYQNVSWNAENPSVADVSNGLVKALAIGNTTITVSSNDGNKTAQYLVAVSSNGGNTPQYTITATAGTGGSVTGGGTYNENETVNLTATPDSGYAFDGWYENNAKVNGASASYSFTATADRTLEARFTPNAATTYTITVTAGTGGSVTGSGTYNENETVNLTAIPDLGYIFDGWYENNAKVNGAGASYSFAATSDRTLEARFAPNTTTTTYTITVTAGSGGSVSGGGTYNANDTVTLIATPDSNYAFDGWYENNSKISGTTSTYSFTATNDRTLQARFVASSNNSGNNNTSNNSNSNNSSKNTSANPNSNLSNQLITMSQALSAYDAALKKAKEENSDTVKVTIRNYAKIELSLMKEWSKRAKKDGMKIIIQADQVENRVVSTRLIIDPTNATKDIYIAPYINHSRTQWFKQWASNDLFVISTGQTDSYGQNVEIIVKLDLPDDNIKMVYYSNLNTQSDSNSSLTNIDLSDLYFYSYDKESNSYQRISDTNYRIDKNGYLHFITEKAGDIIVCDGKLIKKSDAISQDSEDAVGSAEQEQSESNATTQTGNENISNQQYAETNNSGLSASDGTHNPSMGGHSYDTAQSSISSSVEIESNNTFNTRILFVAIPIILLAAALLWAFVPRKSDYIVDKSLDSHRYLK